MSFDAFPDLTPSDRFELAAMSRMIQRAGGFALAFVVINHAETRTALINAAAADPGLGPVVTVHLDANRGESIVAQVERAVSSSGHDKPRAVFAVGLESMLEIAGDPLPHLENLNLSRGYCGRKLGWPLIFWTPEYAIREFSRQAGDFWSCRSGVYQIHGSARLIKQTLTLLSSRHVESPDPPQLERELVQDLLGALDAQQASVAQPDYADIKSQGEQLLSELEEYVRNQGAKEQQQLRKKIELNVLLQDTHAVALESQRLADVKFQRAKYGEAESDYEKALQLHSEAGNARGVADCKRGLGWTALMLARYHEAEQLFLEALDLARRAGHQVGEADSLRCLGHVSRILGNHDKALTLYRGAQRLYLEVGGERTWGAEPGGVDDPEWRRGNVCCIESIADVAWMRSQYADAREYYEEGLRLAREISYIRGEAGCTEGLGHVEFMLANYGTATEHYTRALTLYRGKFNKRGEANSLRALGEVARIRDIKKEARQRFEEALAIYRDIGHRRGQADALRALGHLAQAEQDPESAASLYSQALDIYRAIDHRWGQAGCMEGLGDVCWTRGESQAAAMRYQDARLLSQQIGDRKGEANATRDLGDTEWMLDHFEAAGDHYRAAREIATGIGDRWGEAAFIRDEGDAAWMLGQVSQAEALYRRARDLSREINDRWGLADTLRKLGNVSWRQGKPEAAFALYREAWLIYRQEKAARGEAECLTILSKLMTRGYGLSLMPSADPAAELKRAVNIFHSIGMTERAGEASSRTIDELIRDTYFRPGTRGYKPEHRRL